MTGSGRAFWKGALRSGSATWLATWLAAWFAAWCLVPLAAPEMPRLRRLRHIVVASLALLAGLTAGLPLLPVRVHSAAALVWLALAIASGFLTALWLANKIRADNAWAAQECEE